MIANVRKPMTRSVAAFILAGGQSTRMGRDKAGLQLLGKSLLERAYEIARAATRRVYVVGSGEKIQTAAAALGIPAVPDVFIKRGPLAGIYSALTSEYARELNFILAVDTPLITPEFVCFLIAHAQMTGAGITLSQAAGRLHPLCAVYRKKIAVLARAALERGRNKIENAFEGCSSYLILENELERDGFDPSMFLNINTPEDLALATKALRRNRIATDVRAR